MELFNQEGLSFALRWLHVLAGIAWIGLLYYFNLVQVPAFAAYGDEGKARNISIDKLARRALWWFRWAAVVTLVLGLLIIGVTENYMQNFMSEDSAFGLPHNSAIFVGMLMGILMAANVWMVIWKNQKVVLANAANVLSGGEADPNAAGAGRRALLASRQNLIFSISMLFYMVGASHFFGPLYNGDSAGKAWTFVIIAVVIGAILELNCLGKLGGTANTNKLLWPYESHKNAIISAVALWVVLYILGEIFLKA
ncbi:MAG: antitermination protein NusG [Acidimicrobiales bacterium mtb01]|nr:antitermination protein NusG [Actinomycetota bacterium]TEX45591.1 MAG: antitermination protein NusG [Acidimicrobiales bacterium mtb01]